jgi:muramoyltetrapeptide carboxypeptidase
MQVTTIRIIKASSLDREGLLSRRISEIEAGGFRVLFDDLPEDPTWPYCASSVANRAKALEQAFLEEESDAVMWARGGYGASELLDRMPWPTIKKSRFKPIIGFSDVCAVQSACYAMDGRPSIHGPMPATTTWKLNGDSDVNELFSLLRGENSSGVISLNEQAKTDIRGVLFGGCLSVLTNLIGTPYLPKMFADHILIFEDIGENPGRIIRMLNQWHQSGLFLGVKALIFGSLSQLGSSLPDSSPVVIDEIRKRFRLPIFTTSQVGHISPNMPFVVGSLAEIENNQLNWTIRE